MTITEQPTITFEEHRDEVAFWSVVHKADETHVIYDGNHMGHIDALPEGDIVFLVHAIIDANENLALYCPLCAAHIRAHICGDIEWVEHEYEHEHDVLEVIQ